MAKKAAKRARLESNPKVVDEYTSYFESHEGIEVSISRDPNGGIVLVSTIPWSMIFASVRRYNDVQRQKCQAKRASK